MEINNYIKQLREKAGYSQEQLGEMVGVKKAAVNKWETGLVKNLKRETILKLSNIFNVSPANFVLEKSSGYINGNAELTEQEMQLLDTFRLLDDEGKEELLNSIKTEG